MFDRQTYKITSAGKKIFILVQILLIMKNTFIITLICFSAFSLGQVPEFPKFKEIDAVDVTIDLNNNISEGWDFRFENLNELPERLSLGSEFSGKIKADLDPIGQKDGRDLNLLCEFKDGKPNGLQYYIHPSSVVISRYRDGIPDGLQEKYWIAANGKFYLLRAERFENEKLVWEFAQYNYGQTDEFSCSEYLQNGRVVTEIEIYKNDGVQYVWNYDRDGHYSGVQQVFDLDSVLLLEVNLTKGNGTIEVERKHDNQHLEFIDGFKHYETLIYKNGQLKREKIYRNQQSNAYREWREWYKNGQLKHEENENGFKEWYKNGQLKHEENENGVKEWYKNGQLYFEENENGVKEWYKNGQLYFEEIHGQGYAYRVWYKNGQLQREEIDGNEHDGDVQREWYKNGQLKHEENENGVKEWYENGQLKREEIYGNEHDGDVQREWYKNGQLKHEENENGFKEWHKNGRLKHEELYENE